MATWKYWDDSGAHEWADKDERLPAGTMLFKKEFLQQFVDASNERTALYYGTGYVGGDPNYTSPFPDTYAGDDSWGKVRYTIFMSPLVPTLNDMWFRLNETIHATNLDGTLGGGGAIYPTTWTVPSTLGASRPYNWTAALIEAEVTMAIAAVGSWSSQARSQPIQSYDLTNGFGYSVHYGDMQQGDHVGYWTYGVLRQVMSRVGARWRRLYWEQADADAIGQRRLFQGGAYPSYAAFVAAYLATADDGGQGTVGTAGCVTSQPTSGVYSATNVCKTPAWPYLIPARTHTWKLFRKAAKHGVTNFNPWNGSAVVEDTYALIDEDVDSGLAKHIPATPYEDIDAVPPNVGVGVSDGYGIEGDDYGGILCMAIDWEYQ